MNDWIPVERRLPKPQVIGGEVALFVPVIFALHPAHAWREERVCAGRFYPDKRHYRWRSLQGIEYAATAVTHWMALPKPPRRTAIE